MTIDGASRFFQKGHDIDTHMCKPFMFECESYHHPALELIFNEVLLFYV